MHIYDDKFFETADRTAALSADGLLRHLAAEIPIRSVLDIGCGRGVWLSRWLAHGATEVTGVDGPYIDASRLAIPRPAFVVRDVSARFSLDRKFDLVQSLEVAEHVSEACAETFVDNLVAHGTLLLFSAAVPGQGGEHHVNEQPWEYWRAKFAARGYEVFDFIRPWVRDDQSIYFCYRYNSFVFAHRSRMASLPAAIRATHVPAGTELRNDLPSWLRFRFAAMRHLPQPVIDSIARAKYRLRGLVSRGR